MYDTAYDVINSISEEFRNLSPLNKKGIVVDGETKRGVFIRGKFHRKQPNNVAAEKRILRKKRDALYKQLMDGLIKKSVYEVEYAKLVPTQVAKIVEEEKKEDIPVFITKHPKDIERKKRSDRSKRAKANRLASKIAGYGLKDINELFKEDRDFIQSVLRDKERNAKNRVRERYTESEKPLDIIKEVTATTKANSIVNQVPRPAPKKPLQKLKSKKKSKYDNWTPKFDELDVDPTLDDKGRPIGTIFTESAVESYNSPSNDDVLEEEAVVELLRCLRSTGDWRSMQDEFPFLTNIVVYIIQLCEANSMVSYAAATYQFATIVTQKFASARDVVDSFIRMSYEYWPKFTQSLAGPAASVVDKLTAILGSNLVEIFHKFMVQMVSYNIFSKDLTPQLNDFFGKEKPMNMIEFMTFLGNSLVTFLKIGEGLMAGLPYSEFLYAEDPVAATIHRTEMILAHHDNVYTGKHVDGQMAMIEYMTELKTCIDALEALSKKLALKPKKKLEVMKILPKALASYNEKKNILESTTRLTPHGLMIYGPPGIGKSFIFIGIAKEFCKVLGLKFKPSYVYNQNPYSEYIEGYEPLSHVMWRIPELGSLAKDQAKSKGDNTTTFLTSLIDRLPITVNSAFEGKGKVRVLVNGVFIDTNSTDLNLDVLVKNPAAYERRFLILYIRVLEQFQREGSYRLDTAKSLAAGGDPMCRWEFKLTGKTPLESEPNTKTVEFTICDWCEWPEFKEVYRQVVEKHFEQERAVQAAEAELIETEAGIHSKWDNFCSSTREFMDDVEEKFVHGLNFTLCYVNFCMNYGSYSLFLIILHILAALCHILLPMLPNPLSYVIKFFLSRVIERLIQYVEFNLSNWADAVKPTARKYLAIGAGFATFAVVMKLFASKNVKVSDDEDKVIKYVEKKYNLKDLTYEMAMDILSAQTLLTKTEHQFMDEFREVTGRADIPIVVAEQMAEEYNLNTVKMHPRHQQMFIDSVRSDFKISENISYAEALEIAANNNKVTEASTFKLETPINVKLNKIEDELACFDPPRKVQVNASELWNKIYEVPDPKCLNEPEQIARSINNNVRQVKLSINGQTHITHILGIYSNYAVINAHALQGKDKIVMAIRNDDVNQFMFTFDRKYSHVIAPDIILFRVKCTNFRDIRPYVMKNFPLVFPLTSCNGSIDNKPIRLNFMNVAMTMHDSESAEDIMLPRYIMYKTNHGRGMCGLPVIAHSTAGWHLVGIHCAGDSMSDFAYAAPLIGCSFPIIDDGTFPVASEGNIVTQSMLEPIAKSPFRHEFYGAVKYLGKLPGKTMLNSESELTTTKHYKKIPTIFDEQMEDDEGWLYGPPPMKPFIVDGVWKSPYNNALRKFNRGQVALNPDILRRVKNVIKTKLSPYFKDCSPTTIEAAVNGINQDNISRRINVKSAAGVGYPGKKANYLPIVEENDFLIREPIESLKVRIFAKLEEMANGYTTDTVSKASPKDEAREREKNREAKTRLFYGVQLDSLIIQRMFLFPFFSKMIELQDQFYTAIGINMHKDADDLIRRFIEFSPFMMEGDYAGFEFNVPYEIVEMACTLIYELLSEGGYTEKASRILATVLTEMIFPLICICLDIIQAVAAQPSGNYGTAEFNSFKQLVLKVYVYIALTDRDDFFLQVLAKTYGDDLIAAIKKDILELYNNITFANYCKQYLMLEFTPSSKSGDHKKYLEISECSFLKRNFMYNTNLGRWVAPLNKKSICKALMLYIPSKSITKEQQQVETMISMLFESYLMSQTDNEYENIRSQFIDMALDLGFGLEELQDNFPNATKMRVHFT